jgi:hypothetical protein
VHSTAPGSSFPTLSDTKQVAKKEGERMLDPLLGVSSVCKVSVFRQWGTPLFFAVVTEGRT